MKQLRPVSYIEFVPTFWLWVRYMQKRVQGFLLKKGLLPLVWATPPSSGSGICWAILTVCELPTLFKSQKYVIHMKREWKMWSFFSNSAKASFHDWLSAQNNTGFLKYSRRRSRERAAMRDVFGGWAKSCNRAGYAGQVVKCCRHTSLYIWSVRSSGLNGHRFWHRLQVTSYHSCSPDKPSFSFYPWASCQSVFKMYMTEAEGLILFFNS